MHSTPSFAGPSKRPSPPASKPPKELESSTQKIHRAQVNNLLMGADRLLLTPRADSLTSYFMDRLSDGKFYNTYRSMAFMRSIRFCLERHLFDVAISLYDRMLKEGFVAVYALCLRMEALKIVKEASRLRDTMDPLKKIFKYDAYGMPSFMDLVHYLINDKHASAAFVDDLAHAFVSIQGVKLSEYPTLVGEMASINMRANRLDAAHEWLKVFEDTCVDEGVQPDVTPYSDIVDTLNEIDPKNADAIQDVLLRMQFAGALPDVGVFNSLIRVNLVQQRYQEAFALYDVLMEKRSEELRPNDVTFKMFFRATLRLSSHRSPVTRRHRRPENAVPPRKLFRDMVECHLERTDGQTLGRSTVMSVSAFHLALRTFMALEDYAAAFTLIRSLSLFGFQPNLQTYLIVFVSLLQRMKYEARLPRRESSYRLVDFLTHLRPNEDPDLHTLMTRIDEHQPAFEHTGASSIGTDTIAHLLSLGEHRRQSDADLLDAPLFSSSWSPSFPSPIPRRRRHSKVPSISMLTGDSSLAPDSSLTSDSSLAPNSSHGPDSRTYKPTQSYFSPTPLARILQKTLMGELFRKAVRRDEGWDWKGAVGVIVRETWGEMVPVDLIGGSRGVGRVGAASKGAGVGTGMAVASKEMVDNVVRRTGMLPFAASRIRRRRRSARGGREIEL